MQKNICLAQNIKELKFILNNIQKDFSIVPLNLETYLYCLEKKLNFLNPKNFISNNFHDTWSSLKIYYTEELLIPCPSVRSCYCT